MVIFYSILYYCTTSFLTLPSRFFFPEVGVIFLIKHLEPTSYTCPHMPLVVAKLSFVKIYYVPIEYQNGRGGTHLAKHPKVRAPISGSANASKMMSKSSMHDDRDIHKVEQPIDYNTTKRVSKPSSKAALVIRNH